MVNRRKFMTTAATFAAAAATSQFVFAEDKKRKEHSHSKGVSSEFKNLGAAASDCTAKGEACLQHCFDMLSTGDASMASCAKSVREMMIYCHALSQAAAQGSNHIKQLAKIAAESCAECEKECRKHADHHETCRECAESCAECLKLCKSISA